MRNRDSVPGGGLAFPTGRVGAAPIEFSARLHEGSGGRWNPLHRSGRPALRSARHADDVQHADGQRQRSNPDRHAGHATFRGAIDDEGLHRRRSSSRRCTRVNALPSLLPAEVSRIVSGKFGAIGNSSTQPDTINDCLEPTESVQNQAFELALTHSATFGQTSESWLRH